MAKGNPWERKALLKELREKHGFSEDEADSMGRASNATTSLVLEKLNAVGASPEQQQEDLNTFLEAHVKRRIYEQGLEKEPDKNFQFVNSFIMYFLGAILISIGVLMYFGSKDLVMGAFIGVMGVGVMIINFYLQKIDKRHLHDYADLIELYREDYEEAQAKLDKLLTRIGGKVEDDLIEEDKAFIDEFIKDNP